VQSKKYQQ